MDVFLFEMARKNKKSNKVSVVVDCEGSDLNTRFICFLVELTLKHYPLSIPKVGRAAFDDRSS